MSRKKQHNRHSRKKDRKKATPPAARKPMGVSWGFLEGVWTAEPLPSPGPLQSELERFDAMATTALREHSTTLVLPCRTELARQILGSFDRIFTQAQIEAILKWLAAHAQTSEDGERVQNTATLITRATWPLQVAALAFLVQRWTADLPERLRRWLPMWTSLESTPEWPSRGDDTWHTVAAGYGVDLAFEAAELTEEERSAVLEGEEHVRFSELYDLIVAAGRTLAWAPMGGERFQDLATATIWFWARKNQDRPVAQRVARVAAAAGVPRHPLVLLCMMANDICATLPTLMRNSWEAFLDDPSSLAWSIDLAYRLEDAGRLTDAYDLLERLAREDPTMFPVHGYLAQLAFEMHLPSSVVEAHIAHGLESLEVSALARDDAAYAQESREEMLALRASLTTTVA